MARRYGSAMWQWALALAAMLTAGCSAHAARSPKPVFDGEWSVQWCDRTAPDADCGGFSLSLVQQGDRLCGTYDGARVRLSQLDEGAPRAIHGVVIGNDAVLTIESARSGDIHLVHASVRGDAMRWRVVDTVHEVEGDIDIIALDDTLRRAPPKQSHSERRAETVSACRPKTQAH